MAFNIYDVNKRTYNQQGGITGLMVLEAPVGDRPCADHIGFLEITYPFLNFNGCTVEV